MCGTCYHRARRYKAQTRGRSAFQQEAILLRRARSIADSAGGKVTLELLVEKLRVRERRAQRVLRLLEGGE